MNETKKIKAIGMISGGLDSTLAIKVMKDHGIDVYGLYCAMPWGCGDEPTAQKSADEVGIPLEVVQLNEDYLDLIKNPNYGYGAAINPCVDCKIYMIKKAAEYKEKIGADFIFTGEVLGQRPMSQLKQSLKKIEIGCGLDGYLVRPLSAQFLDPTIPEEKGWIDRTKLLGFTGRSRKDQIALAKELGLTAFNQPAGGCLLTDQNFARRIKDAFTHGYKNLDEIVALRWGRHFRINEKFKITLGRDANENECLTNAALNDDIIMKFKDVEGPWAFVKGENPPDEILQTTAGMMQKFSRYKNDDPLETYYWIASHPNELKTVAAKPISTEEIEKLQI